MEELEPIYDFQPLRDFLIENGFIVEKAQGYREIRPEEVTVDAFNNGEIEFFDDGIYVVNTETGEKQQVFLYMRNYHLELYGKPRFHICKCVTIEQFVNDGLFSTSYVRANSDPVPVRNIDNNNEEETVSDLPLCKNCLRKIREYGQINSSEFVEVLRQARGSEEIPQTQEVNILGYSRDWDSISRNYKEKHNYTCEECGLKIDNPFDRQYIHCHHVDGNKTNNRSSNLRCLCLRCHANVDAMHKIDLTANSANRIVWEAFNAAYPPKKVNII